TRFELEDRPGQGTGAAQQRLALARGALEQLAHDAERDLALELPAARGEYAHTVRRRSRGAEQPRLADAGRPVDHRDGSVTGAGLGEQGFEQGGLGLAFEQWHWRSHVRSLCRGRTHRKSAGSVTGSIP